jgi:hypothetical protein
MNIEIVGLLFILVLIITVIVNILLHLKLNMVVHTLEIIALLYAICVMIIGNNPYYILIILIYNFYRRIQILFRNCVSHYYANKEDNKKA